MIRNLKQRIAAQSLLTAGWIAVCVGMAPPAGASEFYDITIISTNPDFVPAWGASRGGFAPIINNAGVVAFDASRYLSVNGTFQFQQAVFLGSGGDIEQITDPVVAPDALLQGINNAGQVAYTLYGAGTR